LDLPLNGASKASFAGNEGSSSFICFGGTELTSLEVHRHGHANLSRVSDTSVLNEFVSFFSVEAGNLITLKRSKGSEFVDRGVSGGSGLSLVAGEVLRESIVFVLFLIISLFLFGDGVKSRLGVLGLSNFLGGVSGNGSLLVLSLLFVVFFSLVSLGSVGPVVNSDGG
jgi:hypothetical protein